jgi:serine phosphatase RsbU (regulator of sigma subunit)
VDPAAGSVEVISAGHPPPLLIDAGGEVSFLACEPNTPLGVLDAPRYVSRQAAFAAGSTLLLYTDGLVEARDVPLDQGMERLTAVLAGAAVDGVEQICDLVLDQMVGGGTGDDVAVLAARLLP